MLYDTCVCGDFLGIARYQNEKYQARIERAAACVSSRRHRSTRVDRYGRIVPSARAPLTRNSPHLIPDAAKQFLLQRCKEA